jgi:hypothetical protein
MFELAKAMGDNDEAALVMRMMKNYNRAHPPKASSSVSTASSFVPAEVQTRYSLLQLQQLKVLQLQLQQEKQVVVLQPTRQRKN